MTSIIGIVADKGTVLLSDSQATYLHDPTRPGTPSSKILSKKLYTLVDNNNLKAVAGFAGDSYVGIPTINDLRALYSKRKKIANLMKETSYAVKMKVLLSGSETGTFFEKESQTTFLIGLYHKKPELWYVYPMGNAVSMPADAIGSARDLILREMAIKFGGIDPPTLLDAVRGGYELLYRSMVDSGVGGPAQVMIIMSDGVHDYSHALSDIEEKKHAEAKKLLEEVKRLKSK